MGRRKVLEGQLDLFSLLEELKEARDQSEAGSFNIQVQVKALIGEALKRCPLSRFQVAARMSELLGVEVTKWMLDAWTAESKEYHRFPAEYLPAFCRITGSYELLRLLVEKAGCYLIEGEEVLLTELGRIQKMRQELNRRERAIREYLKSMGVGDE